MSLQDMIRQQNAAEAKEAERHAQLQRQFDEQFETIANQAISQAAKKLYDFICQDIARKIKDSPTVNGELVQQSSIILELPIDLQQYLGQEYNVYLNKRSKSKDGSSIFENLSVIYDTDINDNVTDTVREVRLHLVSAKATKTTWVSGAGAGWYRTTQEMYIENPYWTQYWDCLTKLSTADGVSLKFGIELKKQKGLIDPTWAHHSYVSFGKKIDPTKYKSTPVILYSYTK